MAENTDVIKEFLVSLGVRVDENGLARMGARLDGITGQVARFGATAVSMGAAIEGFVAVVSNRLEDLYFVSRRVGSTVDELQDYTLALQKAGGSAANALGSAETLARNLRTNPGIAAYIQSMGVDVQHGVVKIMEGLAEKLRQIPYPIAYRIANILGIDEETLWAMTQNVNKFTDRFARLYAAFGTDAQKAAAGAHEFQNQLRDIAAAGTALSVVLADRLLPYAKMFGEWVLDAVDWLADLDHTTGGLSTKIIGFGALLAGLTIGLGAFLSVASLAAPAVGLLASLLSPVGLLVAAVAGLGYTISQQKGAWDEWGKQLGDIWDDLKEIGSFSKELGDILAKTFAPLAGPAMDTFKDTLHVILDVIEGALNLLTGKWDKAKAAASSGWEHLKEMGNDLSHALWTGGAAVLGLGVDPTDPDQTHAIMTWFMRRGWSKEQAAGIVANLKSENATFDPKKKGDGGKAVGIAQWHPDRQAEFKRVMGIDISKSNLFDQLEFFNYELTEGKEQKAGNLLKAAQTAKAAAEIISRYDERPKNADAEASKRGSLAEKLVTTLKAVQGAASNTATATAQGSATMFQKLGTGEITIQQKTDININGKSDPAATAKAVADQQDGVNSRLVRNFAGAVQ